MTGSVVRENVALPTFLGRLGDEDAAAARVAAAEIDRLARVGDAMDGIERRFLPWFLAASVAFAAGLWLFFQPGLVNRWLVVGCLASLPGVAGLYVWRVHPRTRADRAAEALNRRHFLPHGGLYFPPGERPACVVLVDWTPPAPEPTLAEAPPDPRKRSVKPGRIW